MNTSHKKPFIFIGHSNQDLWVANQIAREVRSCGAETFLAEFDSGIVKDFEDKILESLKTADELLVLLTPWALGRPYVWTEMGVAWGRGIPIVVILYGMTADEFLAGDIPLFLKKTTLMNINQIDAYFQQLQKLVTPDFSQG